MNEVSTKSKSAVVGSAPGERPSPAYALRGKLARENVLSEFQTFIAGRKTLALDEQRGWSTLSHGHAKELLLTGLFTDPESLRTLCSRIKPPAHNASPSEHMRSAMDAHEVITNVRLPAECQESLASEIHSAHIALPTRRLEIAEMAADAFANVMPGANRTTQRLLCAIIASPRDEALALRVLTGMDVPARHSLEAGALSRLCCIITTPAKAQAALDALHLSSHAPARHWLSSMAAGLDPSDLSAQMLVDLASRGQMLDVAYMLEALAGHISDGEHAARAISPIDAIHRSRQSSARSAQILEWLSYVLVDSFKPGQEDAFSRSLQPLCGAGLSGPALTILSAEAAKSPNAPSIHALIAAAGLSVPASAAPPSPQQPKPVLDYLFSGAHSRDDKIALIKKIKDESLLSLIVSDPRTLNQDARAIAAAGLGEERALRALLEIDNLAGHVQMALVRRLHSLKALEAVALKRRVDYAEALEMLNARLARLDQSRVLPKSTLPVKKADAAPVPNAQPAATVPVSVLTNHDYKHSTLAPSSDAPVKPVAPTVAAPSITPSSADPLAASDAASMVRQLLMNNDLDAQSQRDLSAQMQRPADAAEVLLAGRVSDAQARAILVLSIAASPQAARQVVARSLDGALALSDAEVLALFKASSSKTS